MKKLLSKVFFASDCARGAAFAMTLFTVGNYLWLSFFLMALLRLGDFVPPVVWSFVVGAVLMTIYALAVAVASVVRFVGILRRERRFRALWYLLPAAACLAAGVIGFLRFFPPYGQASVALGFYFWRDFYKPWIDGGFHDVAPQYWAAFFLVALLLILAGGMLLTAMFSAAEGRKLHSAIGRATPTVWGVFALWYLVTLGMALCESREVAAVRAAVEARFGRPLTAAALGSLYREGGPIDAKFWQRQKEYGDALPLVKEDPRPGEEERKEEYPFANFDLPDRPTPEALAWYGRYCHDNRAALARWEGCFDRVPPLPARDFVHGRLIAMPLDYVHPQRYFVRMERNRLSCALASGGVEMAWACYRRMGNAGTMLQKLPFLISHLAWIAVEHYRLTGVEKLLESRLLPDTRLNELDADLAALELAIQRCHRQAMYGEATSDLDTFTALEEGLIDYSRWMYETYRKPGGRAGAFAPYRWIFPQAWYHAALEKEALLRLYLAEDFTKCVPSSNRVLIMSNMLLPSFHNSGRKYYALTARVRGMRALIRAEKYRRQHGEFPKTLDDLPEDPFTGKPLIYEIGPAEIFEHIWEKGVSGSSAKRSVDVVQVRSDPAVKLPPYVRRPEDGKDATRALIRR